MTELPPDVRDRAAIAAQETFYDGTKMAHNSWTRVVDAVAEVLAAEQGRTRVACGEFVQDGACDDERVVGLDRCAYHAKARMEKLRARVAELEIAFAEKLAGVTDASTRHVKQLSERVDLLTAALTGLCNVYHVRPLNEVLDGEETVSGDDGPKFAAWANARAALSATPTAPTPHTCQLPDIATVREPSRRWDCRVCDARWIATGRIVGRRSRYEWHQMPVTKTATPTGCRFCGEPESDTVWCCDERMEADGLTESEAP